MWLLLLPLAAAFIYSCTAETGEAYHGPPQARELFSYNDKLFYFYSDRCSYDEAAAICEAANMHLATLDEPAKAKFAAEAIAEAWMVFEDLWIGARKIELGRWEWQFTNKKIQEEPQMVENDTYMYPPWVNNELPARDGKDCLAVDRNGHNDPYFVDLDCKLPRPFICEQNTKQNKTEPWSGGVVQILETEFILYHGRLSWSAAVSFCRQQGFALATVENMLIARKLAKAMLKSRPEFEDAWIGANLRDEQWTWVETGEEIKTISADYKDPTKGNTPGNILTPQFPPWFEDEPRRGRECAVFDRHLCDEPMFIDLKCNRQRDFICSKRGREAIEEITTIILNRERKRYIFFPVTATWEEAKQICDEEGEFTTMLNLTDIEETKFIMQAMSDAINPIDHLWLGGKIINNEWKWIARNEDDQDNVPIPMVPDETGFPPWCDNETNVDMSCLNLDRQNHWTPLIYGLECNSTQAVICVQPIESNDRIVQYEGSGKDDPAVKLRVTKLLQNPISWYEAEKACTRDIGKLWMPKFGTKESAAAIKKFFNTLQDIQKEDQLVQLDKTVEVYHVNGGRYNAKAHTWVRDKKNLTFNKTGWNPYNDDCLVGQINNTNADDWTWFPVRCYHKLYSQIICQPRCSLSEIPYEEEKSEWLCDTATSEIFDHKMTGMGCSHRCPENTVAVGPERYYCGKDGWFSSQANVPVQASQCKKLEDGLEFFRNISEETATLIFVIDSTSDSPANYNATKYIIGNLIDYYRANTPSIVVSVISIEMDINGVEGAVIKVQGVRPTEDCEQIRKDILNPLIDTGEGIRDFSAGIDKISDALKDSVLSEANIVYIFPEGNQKNNFKDKAKEFNEEAKAFAIGTNRHTPLSQLVDLSSKTNKESYAMQFKKPSDVIPAVKSLMSGCANCKCGNWFNDLISVMENKANLAKNNQNEEHNQAPINKAHV